MLRITDNELSQVITLAEKLRSSSVNYSNSPNKSYKERFLDESLMSPKLKDLLSKEKMLLDYLDSLNLEALEDLLVIMYLGRDKDYNKYDNARTIIKNHRSYFDRQIGSNRDEIISILMDKRPLDDYLKDGLGIIRIQV